MENLDKNHVKALRIVALFIWLAGTMLFVSGCKTTPSGTESITTASPSPSPTLSVSPEAPPPPVSVAITKIDGQAVKSEHTLQVGVRLMVEGTISDPNAIMCVALRSREGTTWYVQTLPGPASKVRGTLWRWGTSADCGANSKRGEIFELIALVEGKRSVCEPGNTFRQQEFPNSLPRSELVTVTRSK